MNSKNEAINDNDQYKTEENKIKENANLSLRNRIINQNKNKFNYNPIRILNNRSTFQIKPKHELSSYRTKNRLQNFYAERNSYNFQFNLRKKKNMRSEIDEEKDRLITQLYYTTMDMNQINREIKEFQSLFAHEEKENYAHKLIISKILQENQKVKVLQNYDSPNSKNKSIEEEDEIENKPNNSTIKIGSFKRGFFSKNIYLLEKNKSKTIPNSIRRIKGIDSSEAKIGTLKKELDFYQKMIESKEAKLKKFNRKEDTMIYKDINSMINQQNKSFANLSKINNELINKVFDSDKKIFDLSQKLCKLREKTNKSIENIELYKGKISEIDFKINALTNERTKRQKEEQEQEVQKSKEESELNSLINEKNILEEKYIKKKELKLEQNDYRKELENSYQDEKKYKLKNEVNSLKLKHCQKKYEELNQKAEEYEKERNNLLEKSKVPRKNKIKIEEMEIELEKLINEYEMYEKQLFYIDKIIEENNKLKKETKETKEAKEAKEIKETKEEKEEKEQNVS